MWSVGCSLLLCVVCCGVMVDCCFSFIVCCGGLCDVGDWRSVCHCVWFAVFVGLCSLLCVCVVCVCVCWLLCLFAWLLFVALCVVRCSLFVGVVFPFFLLCGCSLCVVVLGCAICCLLRDVCCLL